MESEPFSTLQNSDPTTEAEELFTPMVLKHHLFQAVQKLCQNVKSIS